MMKIVVSAAVLAASAGALVPVALAADGAAVYKANCAKCHGETGMADTPAGKALKAPAFPGDAKVSGMAVPDLVTRIKENKKHEGFVKKMSDDDVTAAAGFVKDLAGKK